MERRCTARVLTPTLPRLKLPLLFFLAKTEKNFSNSSPSQVVIFLKLGNLTPWAHICAQRSATYPPVIEEVEEYKNNFIFFRIPDLSFQEVEW
jgi:hypothetical protein